VAPSEPSPVGIGGAVGGLAMGDDAVSRP
jgi:hypothetical protein